MLSEKERNGLMLAYSDDNILYPDTDPMFGTHPKTVRSLLNKGLVTPYDEGEFDSEYDLTAKGRKALGLTGALMKKPARIKTAVVRAIIHFIDDAPELKACVFPPKKLNAVVWLNDEDQADYDDALILVDLREDELGHVDEHCWPCVAKLVGELGFPCDVEANRKIVSFWSQD